MNLDVFNAAFAALDDDTERSRFLVGLSRGMNGGSIKGSHDALTAGFRVGEEMRHEAENFRAKKTLDGLKGGRPRINQDGNQVVNQDGNQNGTQSSILNPLTSERQAEPLPGGDSQSMDRDWTEDLGVDIGA
jgi:hypothetical protein